MLLNYIPDENNLFTKTPEVSYPINFGYYRIHTAVNELVIPEGIQQIGSFDDYNDPKCFSFNNFLVAYHMELPKSLKYIGHGIFMESSLPLVELGDQICAIGTGAFMHCYIQTLLLSVSSKTFCTYWFHDGLNIDEIVDKYIEPDYPGGTQTVRELTEKRMLYEGRTFKESTNELLLYPDNTERHLFYKDEKYDWKIHQNFCGLDFFGDTYVRKAFL